MTKTAKGIWTFVLGAALAMSCAAGLAAPFAARAEEPAEVKPIALYEFKSEDTVLKDSMGKYDLVFGRKWVDGGTGDLWDKYTLVDGGGISFTNQLCMAQTTTNNMFKDVTAFTLAFEVKTSDASSSWGHYVGVGNSAYDLAFVARGDATLNGGLIAEGTSNANIGEYWNTASLPITSVEDFIKIIISAQPGGQLRCWMNGVEVTKESTHDDVEKLPAALPEDWSPAKAEPSTFSIGSAYNGNAINPSTGSLRNVALYDFAMDEACATAYNTNGKLTVDDLSSSKRVTAIEPDFGGSGATKSALNTSMSEAEMFAELNPANVKATLSEGGPQVFSNSPITWTKVEKSGEEYYAVGTANTTKLGLPVVCSREVRYQLTVEKLTLAQEVTYTQKGELSDTMTKAEMLAEMNKWGAKVEVTYGDSGTTKSADVTFTEATIVGAELHVTGKATVEGKEVGAVHVTVAIKQEAAVVDPVAHYEFKDQSNIGKDSTGKNDLQFGHEYIGGSAPENNPLWNQFTPDDGGIAFDNHLCLAQTDGNMFASLTSFTIAFEIKTSGNQEWQHYLGLASLSNEAGFAIQGRAAGSNGENRQIAIFYHGIEDASTGNPFYDSKFYTFPGDAENEYQSVVCSLQQGGNLTVYANGVKIWEKAVPQDWSAVNGDYRFSLGSRFNGAADKAAKGSLRNVAIYGFAMDEALVQSYLETGRVISTDVKNITSVKEVSIKPETLSAGLTNTPVTANTDAAKVLSSLKTVNASAKLSDEGEKEVPVVWKEVVVENGKYIAKGSVHPEKLGYPMLCTTYEVTADLGLAATVTAGTTNFHYKADGSYDLGITDLTIDGKAISTYTVQVANAESDPSEPFSTYAHITVTGEYAGEVLVPVTIHAAAHSYTEDWAWTETEDGYSATLTLTCDKEWCGHVETKAATVTKQVTEPGYTTDGKIVYTAKVTVDKEYTATKEVTI